MNPDSMDAWEAAIRQAAQAFSYPPTPDLTQAVARQVKAGAPILQVPVLRRRLAFALAAAVLALLALLSVPTVRAQILAVLQIGRVKIFLVEPTPTPTASAQPAHSQPPPLPSPTATLLPSLLDLDGETTLEQAKASLDFSLRLPTYPEDLGPADHVYLQDLGEPALILVWLDDERPGQIRMSLHQFGQGVNPIEKNQPQTVDEIRMNGRFALWTTGPYLVRLRNGDTDFRRLIQGHVLIWEEDGVTYRLETGEALEQAVRIAESLR